MFVCVCRFYVILLFTTALTVVSSTYNLRQRRHQRQLTVKYDGRNFVCLKLCIKTHVDSRKTVCVI